MLLLVDLTIGLVRWTVESIGIRRSNWISFGAGTAVGAGCLAHGSPGWAALAFGAAAIDAWTLRKGGYSDER